MPVTDPIADMLTRIRNANTASLSTVDVPESRVKNEIARVLKEEGFISSFETIAEENTVQPNIRITLKYGPNRQRTLSGLKRISKPGLRVYAGKKELPKVLGGLGIAIVSTPQGIMTDRQARRQNLGGEILAYIW